MSLINKPSCRYKDEFQELGSIDEGRYSTVFKARSYKDGKIYAVKKIPFPKNEEYKTSKEVEFLSNLNSDYVVKFIYSWIEENYYIGSTDDRLKLSSLLFNKENNLLLHIQLELCSMPLNYVIKILNYEAPKNSMSSEKFSLACEILVQLLECIKYLHVQTPQIIHRDLKPENIMLVKVDNRRFVKLIDFGLSSYYDFIDRSYSSNKGTRQYSAPETFFGTYSAMSDIFSLGLIMQELFNLDFNNDQICIDESLRANYNKLKDICLKCQEAITSKRPTCKQILENKHLWAAFPPEENSINIIKKIALDKYHILFNFDDYQNAIYNPVKIDEYSKALFTCADRVRMIENNFVNWSTLIDVNRLYPVVVKEFQKKFNELNTNYSYNSDHESLKKFILKNLVNLNNENEFQIFIQCLHLTGHDELAYRMYPPCIDMIDLQRCHPKNGFKQQFTFGLYNKLDALNPKRYLPISYEPSIDCYTMDKEIRGFCFLLVNYFTVGTYKEIQRFRNIFYQLHFEVIMLKNLKAEEMLHRLKSISEMDELLQHDAFVFLSITHGSENQDIYGFDRIPVQTNKILDLFNNENCPNLWNKPKIFFFNCCRGENYHYGVETIKFLASPIEAKPVTVLMPKATDFLVCYSTLDGYKALVDWYIGTDFGNLLADMLADNAWTDDLYNILAKTNDLMVKTENELNIKQTFDFKSSLTKLIKFYPYIPNEIKLVENVIY